MDEYPQRRPLAPRIPVIPPFRDGPERLRWRPPPPASVYHPSQYGNQRPWPGTPGSFPMPNAPWREPFPRAQPSIPGPIGLPGPFCGPVQSGSTISGSLENGFGRMAVPPPSWPMPFPAGGPPWRAPSGIPLQPGGCFMPESANSEYMSPESNQHEHNRHLNEYISVTGKKSESFSDTDSSVQDRDKHLSPARRGRSNSKGKGSSKDSIKIKTSPNKNYSYGRTERGDSEHRRERNQYCPGNQTRDKEDVDRHGNVRRSVLSNKRSRDYDNDDNQSRIGKKPRFYNKFPSDQRSDGKKVENVGARKEYRDNKNTKEEKTVHDTDQNKRRACNDRQNESDDSDSDQDEEDMLNPELNSMPRWLYEELSQRKNDGTEIRDENEELEEGEIIEIITPAWTRSSPADLHFRFNKETGMKTGTQKMCELENKFRSELVRRAAIVREGKPKYERPVRVQHLHLHTCGHCSDNSDDSACDSELDDHDLEQNWMEEIDIKRKHPERLHDELWFNEPGEMNDGPVCRCSLKAKKSGIRHEIYPGEEPFPPCDPNSNNNERLFHYRITMSPPTNFLLKNPTIIEYDNHEYIFEGFSLFSHYRITDNVPVCKVIRFSIEYSIHWIEETPPENFTIESVNMFDDFLFDELLEMLDLKWKEEENGCRRFHLMPRFVRDLPDNGKEILSMSEVLLYMLNSSQPVISDKLLPQVTSLSMVDWQKYVDRIRGMLVTKPGMRPASIRVDQLDREHLLQGSRPVQERPKRRLSEQSAESYDPANDTDDEFSPRKLDISKCIYPLIIHFGIRPAQLSYAGDSKYQRLWKQYVKLKHLLANKPKVSTQDRSMLRLKKDKLQRMRTKGNQKREVTVELSSEGFFQTGIKSDICQHALLLPVLISHLRFHKSLEVLESRLKYTFKDRNLLQLALTHPSYMVNYGSNPDHARNTQSNCGIRQPEYGDRRIRYIHTKKRGINTLISIMSKLGHREETMSDINHYERLEFLGDAVVEFLSRILLIVIDSTHLYFIFPKLEEGGLATYRTAIVQNQHLSVLAKKLNLQDIMLYAHGPDLCHDSVLHHAMANCLEALMGALFLDGGIEVANRVFGETLFDDDPGLLDIWMNPPLHPLQADEPNGDRHWITSSPMLQKLTKFEDSIGVKFTHIRLLARAFTLRSVAYNLLTLGHHQRLEFLGDTVLQLVVSEFLFSHFPDHHEGHLSLLRSSLVNNRNQSIICEDLDMCQYVIEADKQPHKVLKPPQPAHKAMKAKADLVEALLGALYVDKDLEFCTVFCQVCFFPRLKEFIMNQDWNDPKSRLQQCCLTLRELEAGEPDIPIYKVLELQGPTNTRKYIVGVYFRGERLATGSGGSIRQAEMDAANNALKEKSEYFPQLGHQRKVIHDKFTKSTDNIGKNKKENDKDRGKWCNKKPDPVSYETSRHSSRYSQQSEDDNVSDSGRRKSEKDDDEVSTTSSKSKKNFGNTSFRPAFREDASGSKSSKHRDDNEKNVKSEKHRSRHKRSNSDRNKAKCGHALNRTWNDSNHDQRARTQPKCHRL